jgi:hypothetical protein
MIGVLEERGTVGVLYVRVRKIDTDILFAMHCMSCCWYNDIKSENRIY